MLSLVTSTFRTPFTQLVISTFLVIANVWFAVALSRIDQYSWNMHYIKAEYLLFHIVYVTQLFFYDIRLILLRFFPCCTTTTSKTRPATRFCPAREMFLNYNGNRPAACHRTPLHYTVEGLYQATSSPKDERTKQRSFFPTTLSWTHDGLGILISNT